MSNKYIHPVDFEGTQSKVKKKKKVEKGETYTLTCVFLNLT